MDTKKSDADASEISGPLQTAIALEQDGAYGESLTILEPLLDDPSDRMAYQAAARSLLATFSDASALADWSDARRDLLCNRLILQEALSDDPPALATCIAHNHSVGVSRALEGAAAALRGPITKLWDQGERGRSFLLLVLLLRRHLGNEPPQGDISQWHIEKLSAFLPSHMRLPYNTVFDRENFRANVEDIRQFLETVSAVELARRFSPWQIVLLHWITNGAALDRMLSPLIDALRADRTGNGPDGADTAALRSLSLRAAALGQRDDGLDGDLHALAKGWTHLHGKSARAERALDRLQSKAWQGAGVARNLVGRRAPFLKLGRRPRIAVCVSGQLRGYRRAFPSWQRNLLDGADCEFFVHSWVRIGRSGAEHYRAHLPFSGERFCAAYREAVQRIGMDDFMARYPKLFLHLKQSGDVSRDELSAFYGTDRVVVEDDNGPGFAGWSNSRKMHYKIAAAHGLIGERLGEFDLVLRVRPDKDLGYAGFVWSDLLAAADAPVIFTDAAFGHQYSHPLIGDQVAIGSPKVMQLYADAFALAPKLGEQRLFNCVPDFHGHTSLAQVFWHAGVDVQRLPIKMGLLLETEAIPAQDVAHCLRQDAAGRMDQTDRLLLAAIHADLAA